MEAQDIVAELKGLGWSAEDIAADIGASPRQVYRWANGEFRPLPVYLKALQRLLIRVRRTAA